MDRIGRIRWNGMGCGYRPLLYKEYQMLCLKRFFFFFSLIDRFRGKSVLSSVYLVDLMHWFNKNCTDVKTNKPKIKTNELTFLASLAWQHVKIRLWKNLRNLNPSNYKLITTKSGAKQIPVEDLYLIFSVNDKADLRLQLSLIWLQ